MALVFARSGLGIKHGIALSNGVGVIDSDYRGEIRVGLTNLSDTSYTVMPGDRVAQLAVVPVVQAALERVEELREQGLSLRDAVKQAAKETGLPKNELYDRAVGKHVEA